MSPSARAALFVLLACAGCGSPETTSSGGGQTTSSSGGTGGVGGQTTSGSGGDTGGGGGPMVSPNCQVPPGASDLIHEGIPADGLTCTRFPYPLASPRDVVLAADGTIFVTEFGAGRIVRLTDSGFVTVAEYEEEDQPRWYLRQMLGSANFRAGTLMRFMSGNLSHQIEHHLFPDLPSNRYHEIAPQVEEIFERYGLTYTTGPLPKQVASAWAKIIRLSLPNRPDRRKQP